MWNKWEITWYRQLEAMGRDCAAATAAANDVMAKKQ